MGIKPTIITVRPLFEIVLLGSVLSVELRKIEIRLIKALIIATIEIPMNIQLIFCAFKFNKISPKKKITNMSMVANAIFLKFNLVLFTPVVKVVHFSKRNYTLVYFLIQGLINILTVADGE